MRSVGTHSITWKRSSHRTRCCVGIVNSSLANGFQPPTRPGKTRTQHTLVQLITRMALENPSWGYTRLQGALSNLGHTVGRGTIARILKDGSVDPAPERGKRTRWSTFLKAHWECLVATDFLSVEVCTWRGLVTHTSCSSSTWPLVPYTLPERRCIQINTG
jgi:hypothetical protein